MKEELLTIEKAVLSIVLAAENGAASLAENAITPQHFTDPRHAAMVEIILNRYANGLNTDMLTLFAERDGRFTPADITGITNSQARPNFFREYCEYLRKSYVKREADAACIRYASDKDVAVWGKRINELAAAYNAAENIGRSIRNAAAIAEEAEKEMERRIEKANSNELPGISTGISSLDGILLGWQTATLNVVAGRPGMGKSAVAVTFAVSAAMTGRNVLIFSLEMSAVQFADRIIRNQSEIICTGNGYNSGRINAEMREDFKRAKQRFAKLPIYIDDTPAMGVQQIKAAASNFQQTNGLGMVIVDYLQLVEMDSTNKNFNREQQVTQASRAFKVMAKELGVPVLMLAQLNRDTSKNGGREPQLCDLRESGAIEQDADTVTFIHRPAYYAKTPEDRLQYERVDPFGFTIDGVGVLIVAKHRAGATGRAAFRYNGTLTKMWSDGEPEAACTAVEQEIKNLPF